VTQDDHSSSPEADATQPVEVRRYGPPPSHTARPASWAAPANWSNQAPMSSPPAQRRGPSAAPLVAIALVAGIVSGGLSAAAVTNMMQPQTVVPTGGQTPTGTNVNSVTIDESSAVITAAQRALPAVVKIASTSNGLFGGQSGIGSGFIFDSNGWILTNRHVVSGADKVTVILNDSRQLDGTIYGIDTLTDLAIVKIDASGLPTIALGDSGALKPGQLAIAIGNPLGEFENTVTTGIISGLGRQIVAGDAQQSSSESLNNLIQTDAAINPGNSGGPLLDSAGQVIGLNTAVNQDAQGIGFAIPIDMAKPIMQQALNGDELQRPWIGVYYTVITKQLAQDRDLPVDTGVLIDSSRNGTPAVFPNSPAADAGLKAGDIITAIDGQSVGAQQDLSDYMLEHMPGDTVTLRVLRSGSTREIQVTLGVLPAQTN
jgi:S1-C subfamily serine protease